MGVVGTRLALYSGVTNVNQTQEAKMTQYIVRNETGLVVGEYEAENAMMACKMAALEFPRPRDVSADDLLVDLWAVPKHGA